MLLCVTLLMLHKHVVAACLQNIYMLLYLCLIMIQISKPCYSMDFFLLLLALVASDTLKLFALFFSPNLCKITLQINVTEVKIISSDFSVLHFLSKICNDFIIRLFLHYVTCNNNFTTD